MTCAVHHVWYCATVYGAMRCAVLGCFVPCYAMCGTELACGGTRRSVGLTVSGRRIACWCTGMAA
eukprot:277823-Rhodomonas_salina.2